jgi:hypothetical protein
MQNTNDYSPVQAFLHNKWVRIVLIANAIIIIVIICLLIWQNTKVSTVNLNITPVDATISINGDKKYQNGQYSITPGTYDVTISHEELEPKHFTIDIAPQSVVTVSTFLSDADQTFDFYKLRKNYPSYAKLEEIASADNNITTDQDTSAETFIANFNEQYTLIENSLPIRYASYEHDVDGWDSLIEQIIIIQPKKNDSCNKTLCVKALMGLSDNKEQVNVMLKEKNINTEEVEILYAKD